jgi:hypothetical protein
MKIDLKFIADIRATCSRIIDSAVKNIVSKLIDSVAEQLNVYNQDCDDPISNSPAKLISILQDIIASVNNKAAEIKKSTKADADSEKKADAIFSKIVNVINSNINVLERQSESPSTSGVSTTSRMLVDLTISDDEKYWQENRLRLEQQLLTVQSELSQLHSQTLHQIKEFAEQQRRHPKEIFICYAWPDNKEEQDKHLKWVQPFLVNLRHHLEEVGFLRTLLDIKDNLPGANIIDYMKKAETADFVLLIGTPTLLRKHEQGLSAVTEELIKINRKRNKDRGEDLTSKYRVFPLLISGEYEESFPANYELYSTIKDWKSTKSYHQHLQWLINALYQVNEAYFNDQWGAFFEKISDVQKSLLSNGLPKEVVLEKLKAEKIDLERDQLARTEEGTRLLGTSEVPGAINPIMINVPPENERFKGRSAQIQTIEKKLSGKDQRVFICGMGGIGKTQLAKSYVYEHSNQYDLICWFDMGGDLDLQYESLVQQLNPSIIDSILDTDKQKKLEKIRQQTIKWISQKKYNWLFIFDGATVNWRKIKSYCPRQQKDKRTHVIITSRDGSSQNNHNLKLDVWELEEAFEFVSQYEFSQHETQEKIKELSLELEYIPLAIAQATSYILANSSLDIQGYLVKFNECKLKLQEREDKLIADPESEKDPLDAYPLPIRATIELSLMEIRKEPHANKLLEFCSLLHNIKIPAFLLKEWLDAEVDFDETMTQINHHSLIDPRSDKNFYDMHKTVQEIVLLQKDVKKIELAREALVLLTNVFKFSPVDQTSIDHCDQLKTHIENILPLAEFHNDFPELYKSLGMYYRIRLHENKKALDFLLKNNDGSISSERQIAKAYLDINQRDKAQEIYDKLLVIAQADNGCGIFDKVDIYCDLGVFFSKKNPSIEIRTLPIELMLKLKPAVEGFATKKTNSNSKRHHGETQAMHYFNSALKIISDEEKNSSSDEFKKILIQKKSKTYYYLSSHYCRLAQDQFDTFKTGGYNKYKLDSLNEASHYISQYFSIIDSFDPNDFGENYLFKANAYYTWGCIIVDIENMRIKSKTGDICRVDLKKARVKLRKAAELFHAFYTDEVEHAWRKYRQCYDKIMKTYELQLTDKKGQEYLKDLSMVDSINKKDKSSSEVLSQESPDKVATSAQVGSRRKRADDNPNISDSPKKSKFVPGINTAQWYTDGDISSYIDLIIRNELGDYKKVNDSDFASSYLLSGNDDGKFPSENNERYYVTVTPAIDTVSSVDPIDSYLDKSKQRAPAGNRDDRRDVFDELLPCLLSESNCLAKILFPYNRTQSHWLTGEIRIRKQNHHYQIEILAHDPFGGGQFNEGNFEAMRSAIEKRIRSQDAEATFQFQQITSPYNRRQARGDSVSCGVIVCEDLLKRISGIELSQDALYMFGAKDLREKHINKFIQYLNEANPTRINFIKRNTIQRTETIQSSTQKSSQASSTSSTVIKLTMQEQVAAAKKSLEFIKDIENAEFRDILMSALLNYKLYTTAEDGGDVAYIVGITTAIIDRPVILTSEGNPLNSNDVKMVNQICRGLFTQEGKLLIGNEDLYALIKQVFTSKTTNNSSKDSITVDKPVVVTPLNQANLMVKRGLFNNADSKSLVLPSQEEIQMNYMIAQFKAQPPALTNNAGIEEDLDFMHFDNQTDDGDEQDKESSLSS